MTLAFVTPSFFPAFVYGGPTVANYALCKALAAQGVHISVVTTDANGKNSLQVEKNKPVMLSPGLSVTYYKEQIRNRFSWSFIKGARAATRKADAVHIQSVFSIYTILALRFAKKYGKTVLLSPNGSLGSWSMQQGNRFKKAFVRLFIGPSLSHIVFHTSSAQEAEEIKILFPEAICTVIANGVYLNEFSTNEKPDRGAYLERFAGNARNPDAGIVVTLCRLHKVKGLDILIRSVHLLRQRGRNIILLIAGPDFGEKEYLQRLASEFELQDVVFFTGELGAADKTAFLNGADVFALPSFHENFGIAYLEALAAGLPVVASRQTPWQEVEKAECGRWVDNTPEDFAEAIQFLLEKGKTAVSGNARTLAGRFSWDNIARQFIEAYRSAGCRL